MRAILVLVLASCAGSQSETSSSVAACELDTTMACSAPAQIVVAGEATPISAGVTYEVSGTGELSFTATITGTHTVYFDSDPHVCDFHVLQPTCESAVACPMFSDARQYVMVAGEDYEIRVPDGAHVRIESGAPTGPGPTITWTSGPPEGGTSGPVVNLSFEVTAYASLDCRLDGTAGPCPSTGLQSPPSQSIRITKAGLHVFEVRAIDAAGNISVATKSWTTICNPPSAVGALALLHLDDTSGQLVANDGAAPDGVLGATTAVEPSDPMLGAAGRFGRAVSFAAGDQITWPLQLGTPLTWSVEMWLRPQVPAVSATQDVLVTGDASLVFRTLNDSGNAGFAVLVNGVEHRVGGFTSGTWHKLLASYDGEALRIWIDNAMYYFPGTWPVTLDDLRIGGDFVGVVDEVWISEGPIVEVESGWDRFCPL